MLSSQLNKIGKWIVFLFCLIVFIVVFYLFSEKPEQLGSLRNDNAKEDNSRLLHATQNTEFKPIDAADISTQDYQYCSTLVNKSHQKSFDWGREQHQSWEAYLSQGYSLDEVTLAVEFFANSNFAVSFRVEQLRKNSPLSKANREIKDSIEEANPEFFKNMPGLSIERKIPASELSELHQLSAKQRKEVLQQTQPSIDDVAYFVRQEDVSNSVLIELVNALDDPNAIVGYSKIEAISLLDYAIEAARYEIVDHLLKIGLQPTSDGYLGSSMERALSVLGRSNGDETQKVQIVLLLQSHAAKARFEQKSEHAVVGYYPRYYFSFDASEIQYYLQNYGLDLTQVEPRDALKVDEQSELIQTLAKQKAEYLEKQFNTKQLDSITSDCQLTIERVDRQWQPRNAEDVIAEVAQNIEGQHQKIEAELAKIDPSLVDLYRFKHANSRYRTEPIEKVNHYFRPLKEGKIHEVIDRFASLPLSDNNKNWAFIQILMYDMHFYDELVLSELMVDKMPFSILKAYNKMNLESIRALSESGADLFEMDSRGKSLFFYATQTADLDLIKYMVKQQVPFKQEVGEDPLHVALNKARYRFSRHSNGDMFSLVDAIMESRPEIDEFHLRRMAVLRLKDPKTYQQIIDKYPKLAINEDIPFPLVN